VYLQPPLTATYSVQVEDDQADTRSRCPGGMTSEDHRGASAASAAPQGDSGLSRPDPLPVEATFSDFVVEFGGRVVAESVPKGCDLPENADYFFPTDNVVAELKCLEKDLFNTDQDVERILRIIVKHRESGSVSGYEGLRWALGQRPTPPEYRRDMLSLARRYIEGVLRKAAKQIEGTRELLNAPTARGLVLLANDGNYFADPAQAFALVNQVMLNHFMDSAIDGFVYFTANTVANVPEGNKELIYWVPAYRRSGDELAGFVNRLGAAWGDFYARRIGQVVPCTQTEDPDVLRALKLIRNRKRR